MGQDFSNHGTVQKSLGPGCPGTPVPKKLDSTPARPAQVGKASQRRSSSRERSVSVLPTMRTNVPQYQTVVVASKTTQRSMFRVPPHLDLKGAVGSGAFGNVAAFTDARTGAKVAVKKIAGVFNDECQARRVLREVKLLRQLDHRNIVRLLDICPPESSDFDDLYLVTELMEIDLQKVISSKQPLIEEHHRFIIHQIFRATAYLHSADIVHRDLKPQNILVNKDCDVKICDFGLARVLNDESRNDLTECVVTRWYRAPEVMLLRSQYTKAVDLWAIGLIFCELVNRRPLLAGGDDLDQVRKTVAVLGTPTSEEIRWLPDGAGRRFLDSCPRAAKPIWRGLLPRVSEAATDLARATLRFNPESRTTASCALLLPYFADLNDEIAKGSMELCDPVDWSFDETDLSTTRIRRCLLEEIILFHPEFLENLTPHHHTEARNVRPHMAFVN